MNTKKVVNYFSIVSHNEGVKTSSYEVQSQFQEEILTDEPDNASDSAGWINDRKNPLYKEVVEFLASGAAGYFISVGVCEVIGVSSPDNKILASTIFSFLPYFAGRCIPKALSIWNAAPSVPAEKFKQLIPSVVGSIAASGIGTFFGSLKTFHAFTHKETALLGGVGMLAGKIIEKSIDYYSENNCCDKPNQLKFISR